MQIRNKPDPLWQHGTCDRIMDILRYWGQQYHFGTVSATNKRMSMPGEIGPEVKEITEVMRRAVEMPWNYSDLEYFIKILSARIPIKDPAYIIVNDLSNNLKRWHNGSFCPAFVELYQNGMRARKALARPTRMITIDLYLKQVEGLYRLMECLRDGKTKEARSNLAEVDLSSFS